MAFEKALLNIPALYNELEAAPQRIRLFSLMLRRLYLETSALASSDAAQRLEELRDDTRNVEVVYHRGVLPLVQQCISDIKGYFDYCQDLAMEEWLDNIGNITEEFKAQKDACDALAVIHAQFMFKLRQLKAVACQHMEDTKGIVGKYGEETSESKESSLFRLAVGAGAVIIGIFVPPVAAAAAGIAAAAAVDAADISTTLTGISAVGAATVGTCLVGYAIVCAIAARATAGPTTEIDKKAYDKNAVVAVIMGTLLPALDEFISALESACGSLDDLSDELEAFQRKVKRANDRKGQKRLRFKQINKTPGKIMSICNDFIAILPSIHSELDDVPKQGIDDKYVDKLLLMVKEIFSKHCTNMKIFEAVTQNSKKESKFRRVPFMFIKALLSLMFVYLVFCYCYHYYRYN